MDFIFGNATAVFDHSEIHANGPGYLTAQSRTVAGADDWLRDHRQQSDERDRRARGTRRGPAAHATIALGRPWRPFSRVVYIDTELPANVIPEGWNAWGNRDEIRRPTTRSFDSNGAGSECSGARGLVASADGAQAAQYKPRVFLAGKDHWDPVAEAAKLP